MSQSWRAVRKIGVQLASISGEGMTAEIIELDDTGEIAETGLYPAVTILEDDGGKKWIELYTEQGPVRIPLPSFLAAIRECESEVHNESYYDQSPPTDT
jgi:hypothetical protein